MDYSDSLPRTIYPLAQFEKTVHSIRATIWQ